jgi:hypothetical protein
MRWPVHTIPVANGELRRPAVACEQCRGVLDFDAEDREYLRPLKGRTPELNLKTSS